MLWGEWIEEWLLKWPSVLLGGRKNVLELGGGEDFTTSGIC